MVVQGTPRSAGGVLPPIVTPQLSTIAIFHWHAFIALRQLSHPLPHSTLSLIRQHGCGICCSSVAMSVICSSATTQSCLLHRCPLLTATAILHCAVTLLLLLHCLIVVCWKSFLWCSCWHLCAAPLLPHQFLISGSPPTFSGTLLFSSYYSPQLMAMVVSTQHSANSNPFTQEEEQNKSFPSLFCNAILPHQRQRSHFWLIVILPCVSVS